MRRSLHIIGSRGSGGAERCYIWLLRALKERGYPVTAANRPGSLVSGELSGSVPQVHVSMRNNYDTLSRWRISRAIKDLSPDVVLTYMSRATLLTHCSPEKGPAHVARFDGFYKLKYFLHAHAWVGVTLGLCDYAIKKGLSADRVYHIPNFIDFNTVEAGERLAEIRSELDVPGDALVVVSAGRFIRKKGFDLLLSAFSRLPQTIGSRPVHMVLVGDGELRGTLQKYASELRIAERVSWTGWQTDPDPYYSIADVVAFPSRFEPHGNIIKEAWSHGKALVSTETQGAAELVEHGATGLLAPCEDDRALADALLLLLRDDAMRAALAAGGLERVRRDYAKETTVNRYIELFEKISKKERP